MALLKLLIPLFFCALLVKSDGTSQEPENNAENWETLPLISPVLEYLNSNPNKVYDYKKGVLLTSQNKGDIVEVSIEVHVDCNNQFPEIPCNERTLICHAFMGRDPVMAQAYNVMSDVRCSPKIEITVEDMDMESRNVAPIVMGEQNMGGEKIDLSNEALSPDQGSADFIAVRKDNGPCLGCPFELNRDAEGVEELIDTAVKHIESERTQRHRITYVRKLQQQVVAGLKYTLVADVAQTSCPKDADLSAPCVLDTTVEPFVCEVIFIEKPWISKNKHVIKNNCTVSQEFEPVVHFRPDRDDISNEIIPHKVMDKPYPVPSLQPDIPNYDAMAQSGDMDPNRLAELESQILLDGMFEAPAKTDSSTNVAAPQIAQTKPNQNEYVAVEEPLSFFTDFESLRVEPLPREPSSELKTLTASMSIVDEQMPMVVMYTPQNEEFDRSSRENVLPEFRSTMDAIQFDYYPTAFDPSRLSRELNSDYSDQGTKQEVLTKRAAPSTSEEKSAEENSDSNSEEKKPAPGRVGVVKREAANTSKNSDSSSDSDSDEDKQKKNEARPSKSESNCDDDSDSSDSTEEDKGQEKECRSFKIRKSKTKDVKGDSDSSDSSEENRKTDSRDYGNNVNRERRSVGQLEKISPDEKVIVRDLADFAAATLDSIDDDHHKRVILQILGAKKLKLDGIYYQIILRLGISHCLEYEHHENCRDKLFTNLTKICKVQVHIEDDLSNPKVVKSQCQNIKKDENDRRRTNYSRYRRQVGLVGGQSSLPESEAHEYLQKCLVHLASSSPGGDGYKVEELLTATKQVVAGSLFRISARLSSSKCAKEELEASQCASTVCHFKIWEKPWMNFTQITANCDGMPEKTFRSKREIGGLDRTQLLGADALSRTPDHLKAIEIIKQALNYLSTKTHPGKVYTLVNVTHAQHTDMLPQFELWHLDADIALCQRTGLMPSGRFTFNQCPEKAENIDCHFGVLKRPSVLEGLKVIIDCENDDRTYVYEPVKKLDDRLGSADELEPAFREFAAKYKKVYDDETEFRFRMKVFRDNLNKIALLNKYEMGTARYGITAFADLTEKEFSRGHGYRPDMRHENELPFAMAKIPDIELAQTVDWRTKGAVTKVKNQGLCGSCWAFSVTGNVEGQYAIKHGTLLEFSEQELVDCDKVDQGCNGGLMDDAYRVIEKLGGLETETDYPYEGDDEKCSFNPNKVRVQLTGALNISHDETDMAKWLTKNGPISIAINANAMQFYFGGVSHPWKMLCSPSNLDHGVLIVGYGTDKYSLFNKTLPYWIVKNSWGTSWGEQGYYRVYRGDGTCGLNQTPSSAIVA